MTSMRWVHPVLFLPVSLLALSAACGDDDNTPTVTPANDSGAQPDTGTPDASGGAGAMTLHFEARVGSEKFSCSNMAMGMGTTNAMIEPLDFRVYVHDVRLINAAGEEVPFALTQDGKWQYKTLALLDFEDKTGTCANGTVDVHPTLEGTAPAGTYTGIKFKIGVPFELNHADVATAPSPLNLSTLFWSWNGGYKFVRIDGKTPAMDAGMDAGMMMDGGDGGMVMAGGVFNIHLGSTECQGDAADGGAITMCNKPNRGEVSLQGFDPLSKTILVDYKALVSGNDMTKELGGAPGCMSGGTDPECPAILTRLGVNPTTGQPDATQQKLFRVE